MSPQAGPEEWLAVLLAREVKNGETVGVGMASPVPAAAAILAHELHAPDAVPIILGSEAYYPFPAGTSELHFMAQRGELDLFFLSALQIDSRGNINLHVIGDYACPTVRLPGAYGSAMLYYMARRVILFRTEHNRRTFVEKADFITAPGRTPEGVYRPGGPALLITPQARLVWDRPAGEWILAAVHAGSTTADVERLTGFALRHASPVAVTPPPQAEEVRVLRTVVRDRLKPIYPEFANTKILPA